MGQCAESAVPILGTFSACRLSGCGRTTVPLRPSPMHIVPSPPLPSPHHSPSPQVPQLDAQQLRSAASEDAQFLAFEAQLARERAVSAAIYSYSGLE